MLMVQLHLKAIKFGNPPTSTPCTNLRNSESLSIFKCRIKKVRDINYQCKICKTYISNRDYIGWRQQNVYIIYTKFVIFTISSIYKHQETTLKFWTYYIYKCIYIYIIYMYIYDYVILYYIRYTYSNFVTNSNFDLN